MGTIGNCSEIELLTNPPYNKDLTIRDSTCKVEILEDARAKYKAFGNAPQRKGRMGPLEGIGEIRTWETKGKPMECDHCKRTDGKDNGSETGPAQSFISRGFF